MAPWIRALSRWSENGKFPFSPVRDGNQEIFRRGQKAPLRVGWFGACTVKIWCMKYARLFTRVFFLTRLLFFRTRKMYYCSRKFLLKKKNASSNSRKRKFSIFAPSWKRPECCVMFAETLSLLFSLYFHVLLGLLQCAVPLSLTNIIMKAFSVKSPSFLLVQFVGPYIFCFQ